MRKPIVASLAAAAVISAGLGAAAASAATPTSTVRHEQTSVDRSTSRAERDRSGSPDQHSSARHDTSRDRSHAGETADR